MKRVGDFLVGIWEFIAGDDWITAVGVVLALGLTALVSESSSAWFVLPVVVAVLLTFSIWKEARRRGST